jgi:hypothetical protein
MALAMVTIFQPLPSSMIHLLPRLRLQRSLLMLLSFALHLKFMVQIIRTVFSGVADSISTLTKVSDPVESPHDILTIQAQTLRVASQQEDLVVQKDKDQEMETDTAASRQDEAKEVDDEIW